MWESKIGTYGVVSQKYFIQECVKITDECET